MKEKNVDVRVNFFYKKTQFLVFEFIFKPISN